MLKEPIDARKIRVRLHWADSAETLTEEVNSNLEAYPNHAIYGMDYQMATIPGGDKKLQEKHFMAVLFRP